MVIYFDLVEVYCQGGGFVDLVGEVEVVIYGVFFGQWCVVGQDGQWVGCWYEVFFDLQVGGIVKCGDCGLYIGLVWCWGVEVCGDCIVQGEGVRDVVMCCNFVVQCVVEVGEIFVLYSILYQEVVVDVVFQIDIEGGVFMIEIVCIVGMDVVKVVGVGFLVGIGFVCIDDIGFLVLFEIEVEIYVVVESLREISVEIVFFLFVVIDVEIVLCWLIIDQFE